MKKITLNLVKGLLAIVLFTGVSVVLSTTGVQTVSAANAAGGFCPQGPSGPSGQAGQVSAANVNQYLINHGYTSIQNLGATSNTSWRAIAINASGIQVSVTVNTTSCQIVSTNEVAI